MHLVQLPKIGMVSESARVVEFVKRVGDIIEIGEPLMTVETEKSVVEVQSSGAGEVARYLVEPGATIAPGATVAAIVASGESLDEAELNTALRMLVPERGSALQAGPANIADGSAATQQGALATADARPSPVKAIPRVRKRAAELGVELSQIVPTGPGGTITEGDVEAAARRPARRHGESLSRAARAIARHMASSWREIPHFHQTVEIDAEPLFAARAALRLSLTPFFVKAAAIALKHHPDVNAHFDGERLLRLAAVDVAIALGDEHSLTTPVIRDVDRRTVAEISRELEHLRTRASEAGFSPQETSGAGFTVSNLGMFGIDTGAPIINSPQVALMFVGAAAGRPAFYEGTLVERRFLKVTLSYDHRVLSGVPAARFSQEIHSLLQRPAEWMAKP